MNDTMVQNLCERNQSTENVGIFIDFDNIYYTLREYGVDVQNERFNIFKILNKIYTKENIRTARAYADFDKVKIQLRWLQKQRIEIKNVYSNGLDDVKRKNASDIELSIDAIEMSYTNTDINTFVFVTSDSDMIPVMNRLMYKGKQVHLYHVGENTSHHQVLRDMCNLRIDILSLLGIDKARASFHYWVDDALKIVNDWYQDENNTGKTLGIKWLKDMLATRLNFTKLKSAEFIEYLVLNNYLTEEIIEPGIRIYRTTQS